jgi:parallel beta-helix repeat protein
MKQIAALVFTGVVLFGCCAVIMADVPDKKMVVDNSKAHHSSISTMTDSQWGPDGWGYTAKDQASGGEAYNWYDITTTGTEVWSGMYTEGYWSDWIQLPFTFPFYDGVFDSISFSSCMGIKFTDNYVPCSGDEIPEYEYAYRINPWCYWMIHDTTSHYYYQAFGDSMFVVSFHRAQYEEDYYQSRIDSSKTLQVLLYSDGRIKFQYHSLNTILPGSPDDSGIDDDFGNYGLSVGNDFYDGLAITFYAPAPGIVLYDSEVTPLTGNISTGFSYSISYRNSEGSAPTVREIHIDGSTYTMTDPGGYYAGGVTMTYGPISLPLGHHTYWFYFEDGTHSYRAPENGVYEGPDVYNPLSGQYDIGGGDNDFDNPQQAALALQGGGISGPVTFNIFSGTYNGQIDLPGTIPGMGAANPIIFQNAPGESPVITSDWYGFYFTGADYVTIQGLEIANCYNDAIATHYDQGGREGDSSNYNRFIGNYIHYAEWSGNEGIYLEWSSDCEVIGNELDSCGYGIYIWFGDRNLVANNMVSNTYEAALYVASGFHNEFYYNSVYKDRRGCAFQTVSADSTILMNNILYQIGPGGQPGSYAIYWDSGVLISDNNDLYVTEGFTGSHNSTYFQTFAEWQAGTGVDAHSISADPNFVSGEDLHINEPSLVDCAGTPIAGIITDFDGDNRSATYPDIGADEFGAAGPPVAVDDLVITLSGITRDVTDITLTWSPVSGAAQYHIYKSTTGPQYGFVLIGSTSNTTYTDSSAIIGETISFYYVTMDNE